MANLDDADAVRGLAPGEVGKMTNPQLKKALATLINANNAAQPTNNVLLEEIRGLRKQVEELKDVKQQVNMLSERLDEAFKVITQQQLFLESLDNRERRRNMVITGLTEDADVTGGTDAEKVRKVIQATGYGETFDPASWEMKRLGQQDERKKRPILVVVEDGHQRNNILKMARNLKSVQGPLSSVYVKKDVHPAVRKEMARLRAREREEKEKAENTGVNITYDWKRRLLLRDGNVIDKFSPYFF